MLKSPAKVFETLHTWSCCVIMFGHFPGENREQLFGASPSESSSGTNVSLHAEPMRAVWPAESGQHAAGPRHSDALNRIAIKMHSRIFNSRFEERYTADKLPARLPGEGLFDAALFSPVRRVELRQRRDTSPPPPLRQHPTQRSTLAILSRRPRL